MENDLLIYFNEEQFNSTISSLNDTITHIDGVIKLYNQLGIGELQKGEFNRLLFDTDDFLFEKIMRDKPTEFAGMRIDKRAFYDQFLIKPKGYSELINEKELFIRRISIITKNQWNDLDIKKYLLKFSSLDNGRYEVKKSVIDEVRKWNEVYVKSEKARRAYELAIDLRNLLNQDDLLKKVNISTGKDLVNFVKDLFLPFEDSTKVEINIAFLQRLDTRSF